MGFEEWMFAFEDAALGGKAIVPEPDFDLDGATLFFRVCEDVDEEVWGTWVCWNQHVSIIARLRPSKVRAYEKFLVYRRCISPLRPLSTGLEYVVSFESI